MSVPKLTELPLWQTFADRVLRVLRAALASMPAMPPDTDELALNRMLYKLIAEANRQIRLADGDGFEYMPAYDGYQAPAQTTTAPEEFETKRPDFIWSLQDHTAPTGLEGCREFVIECKRLGDGAGHPSFNHQYVDRGVVRFASVTHQYGLHGASGAMVGYVQRSDHDTILHTVRSRTAHHELSAIVELGGASPTVALLEQQLQRTFGESPFLLMHLWVDTRPPANP